MSPMFTVIVPVYEGSNFLRECLLSIKNQTFKDFECLVVDDGSFNEFEVQTITSELDDYRFSVFRKNNGGVASALNLGLLHAKGTYSAWLSHDDVWHEDKLLTSLSNLEENSIICSNYIVVDATGKFIAESEFEKHFNVDSSTVLISRLAINGSSVIMPTSFRISVGYFDESLLHVQDYDYWLRVLLKKGEIKFEKKPLTLKRIHSSQVSQVLDNSLEFNYIFTRIIDYYNSKLLSLENLRERLFWDTNKFKSFLILDGHTLALEYLSKKHQFNLFLKLSTIAIKIKKILISVKSFIIRFFT